jgi:uncharacterized protein with von Willebrand factor type A (vWA) domain
MSELPRASEPFVSFAQLLRTEGFAIAPEQVTSFLAAIELLGPRGLTDIRRAGLATFSIAAERRADYEALFRAHFLGQTGVASLEQDSDDEDIRIAEDERGGFEPLMADDVNEAGQRAVALEALSLRRFQPAHPDAALRRFAHEAPRALPRRRGYRRRANPHGRFFDLRRTLREAVKNDGDVMRLPRLKRATRQRRVLLLIDVSGSMKERTEQHLRFAHALARAVEFIEVFTFGTRLTRITRAMRLKNRDQALASAAALVADWDGGTRIGDALQAFLAVPRFAGYARGAIVLILSDGLERGEPQAMVNAVGRLSRRAWHLAWLTPLAADPAYRPQTEALVLSLPALDALADGSSVDAITRHVLSLSERANPAISLPGAGRLIQAHGAAGRAGAQPAPASRVGTMAMPAHERPRS